MPNVKASIQALINLGDTFVADPALFKRFKAAQAKLEQAEHSNGADTFAATAEKLESSEPKIAAAFKKAGVTSRTAGMTISTLTACMVGIAMMEQTGGKSDPSNVFVKENMDFVKANKAELMTVLKDLQEKSAKYKELEQK
jgi:hypothetical protein